jgi:hypothetical protein
MEIIEVLKEAWGWTGLEPLEVVAETDFGHLMVRDVHSRFWRLCPEEAYCKVVAENRAQLDRLTADQEFLVDWHMAALVEQARNALGPLPPGCKYHLAIPGVLGGAYSAGNMRKVPQFEQLRLAGDVGRQIEKLADGALVELRMLD